MVIGVPREIKGQEYRVALLPSAAYQLIKRGHQVLVECNAGVGAGYPDADYDQAGATLLSDHAEVFEKAELVVKVKEPQPAEYTLLRPGQMLFTYLHLAANVTLTEALQKSGVTALAYETLEVNRRLPLLEPMSEIAGRMSILVGGYFLAKHFGGIELAVVPRTLNELHHQYFEVLAHGAEGSAERTGRLALARPGINDEKPFFLGHRLATR